MRLTRGSAKVRGKPSSRKIIDCLNQEDPCNIDQYPSLQRRNAAKELSEVPQGSIKLAIVSPGLVTSAGARRPQFHSCTSAKRPVERIRHEHHGPFHMHQQVLQVKRMAEQADSNHNLPLCTRQIQRHGLSSKMQSLQHNWEAGSG